MIRASGSRALQETATLVGKDDEVSSPKAPWMRDPTPIQQYVPQHITPRTYGARANPTGSQKY